MDIKMQSDDSLPDIKLDDIKLEDLNLDPKLIQELYEYESNLDTSSQELLHKTPEGYADHTKPKKLIATPHEIIFTITAHVMTENEKGEIVSSVEICTQNYHVPVPVNKEYKSYMKIFFDHLEESIGKTIETANEKADEKIDEPMEKKEDD
jgi:hypothetical protein